MKKLFIFSILIALAFSSGANIKAQGNYSSGSLLALVGVEDAAVYYIATDGKKYVFPDVKTYHTWYADFSNVQKVSVEELDNYPDGGAMSYRAGIKLVTHPNTGRVYAVETGGVLRWLPSAEIAVALYGANWANLVQDIIPGYFASSYTKGEDIESMLPNGTIVREESSNIYYYIIDGQKRKFLDTSTLAKNNFYQYSLKSRCQNEFSQVSGKSRAIDRRIGESARHRQSATNPRRHWGRTACTGRGEISALSRNTRDSMRGSHW